MKTQAELIQIQKELEKRGRDLGALRYDERTDNAVKNGRAHSTSFGNAIISENVLKIRDAIHSALNPERGRPVAALKLIKDVDLGVVAMTTLSTLVGSLTFGHKGDIKQTSITTLSELLAKNLFHEYRKAKLDEEAKKHLGNLIQKKGLQGREAIKALDFIEYTHEQEVEEWDVKSRVTLGRLMIELVNQATDLIDLVEGEKAAGAPEKAKAPIVVKASDEINEWIKNHRDEVRLLSPVYLPMVVKPRDWNVENIFSGCYLTNEQAPVPFVKRKKAKQMKRLKEENPTAVFEAVNAIQSTAWRIRKPVLNLLKRIQDEKIDLDLPLSSMPPQNDPVIDEDAPFPVRQAQEKHQTEIANLRSIVAVNVALAEEFAEFDEFFVPHHLDTRGRVYPIPSLNPQGADYVKGLLEFAEGKRLGAEGVFWLKVHVANLFGVDKVSFEDRVKWVDQHWGELLESALSPLDCLFWTKADKPIQAFAACVELLGVSMEGEDYVSRMPIALDGSCSGLQHLGAAFRCEVTGKSVNLIDADKPSDIYQDVADKVQAALESETIEGNKKFASEWLAFCGGKVHRKITKRPVMTYPYGSKASGFSQQLKDDIIKPALQRGEEPFENPVAAAQYMAKTIETAVEATVLKAAEAMKWLQESAKAIAAGGKVIEWKTPLGFPVVQEYRKTGSVCIDTIVFGQRIQQRYDEAKPDIDARKMANAISPNVVHSLDSTHLLLTVLRGCEEEIDQFALIHDSFGTYAADTPRFFQIIREAFVELYGFDVFEYLKEQFEKQVDQDAAKKKRKKVGDLPQRGNLELESVLDSRYSFA